MRVVENLQDDVVKEADVSGEAGEYTVAQAIQTTTVGAHPQSSIGITRDSPDHIIRQTVALSIGAKTAVDEMIQPVAGSNPKRAVAAVFGDNQHIAIRKPVPGGVGCEAAPIEVA